MTQTSKYAFSHSSPLYGLSQDTKSSSLCYTVSPGFLKGPIVLMASQCFLGRFQTSCLIRSPTSSGAVVLHPCTLLQSFLPFPEGVPLLIFSSLMSPGMPPRPCPYQPFILKISFSSINNSLRRETFSDLYFKPVSLTWVSFLHNPHRNQNQAKIYYYDHFIESLCPGKGL